MKFVSRCALVICLLLTACLTIGWILVAPSTPTRRIELPPTRAMVAVSNSGLVATVDGTKTWPWNWSTLRIFDLNTGQEVASPLRAGDQPLSVWLSYERPMFVLREGVVQNIDPITGNTIRRFESLNTAVQVKKSPNGKRLLVKRNATEFDLVDAENETVLWTADWGAGTVGWWINDRLIGTSSPRQIGCADPVDGKLKNNPAAMYFYDLVRLPDRTLVLWLTGPELEVRDLATDETLCAIPVRPGSYPQPQLQRVRFSDDGSAVVIDSLINGRITTEIRPIGERNRKSVRLSDFRVANGFVVETVWQLRGRENSQLQILLEDIRVMINKWRKTSYQDLLETSVFDTIGKRLLTVRHANPIDFSQETALLCHGGRGLVIANNDGLEYYEIPPRLHFPRTFWLLIVGPILLVLGISRSRRRKALRTAGNVGGSSKYRVGEVTEERNPPSVLMLQE